MTSEIQIGPGIVNLTIFGFSGRLTESFLDLEETIEVICVSIFTIQVRKQVQ